MPLSKKFSLSKNVLITAGPTREWMDPVRFISNPSSGSMGIEISKELSRRGVRVTLVLGPTHLSPPSKIKTIHVSSAQEMFSAVKNNLKSADAFVSTAAVGDWGFRHVASRKLKKTSSKTLTIKLIKNPDILAWVGKQKRSKKMFVIGFALETNDFEKNAREKLKKKNLDLIIANRPDSFSSNFIRPTWIEKDGSVRRLGKMSKRTLSEKMVTWLTQQWNKQK